MQGMTCRDDYFDDLRVNCILVRTETAAAPFVCRGYFCNKYLDTMVILMTHNSLARPWKIFSPNQNKKLVTKFRDGIRDFNFDLFVRKGKLWTKHSGASFHGYNPTDEIRDLIQAVKSKPAEIILVQLGNNMTHEIARKFFSLFGSMVITKFDSRVPISNFIARQQQVLIVTSKKATRTVRLGCTTHRM